MCMKNVCFESFLAKYKTVDGYSVVVGGFCDQGGATICLESFKALSSVTFGISGDGVLIDAQLARLLRKHAPLELRIVAASIHIPGATEVCGGVIGDVFSEDTSAEGDFVELSDTIFGFALPGVAAAMMIGKKEDAIKLYEAAKRCFVEAPHTSSQINKFIALASDYSGQIIFVSDGTGGAVGCIYLQESNRSETLWV
jgi:hypothetical protein